MTNSKNTTTKDNALGQVRIVIDRLVRDGKAVAHSDSSVHELFPLATSLAEGQALRDWVTKEKATHTIEVGLGYGVSALFICEGLLINGDKNARHVVLDPHQATRYKDCGLQFLEEAGVAHLVEYHAEESQIALPSFLSQDRHFDLAFIDGSHLFDAVFLDLIYSGRIVRPGAVIFVDDYQLPAIARAVSFCLKNLEWTLEDESHADKDHNWAVLRTAREPIKRSFPHFVDF